MGISWELTGLNDATSTLLAIAKYAKYLFELISQLSEGLRHTRKLRFNFWTEH